MDVQDLRALGEGQVVRADVCVVGAGPVGLTLAAELARLGVDVLVLESGGRDPDPFADELNVFESIGAERVMDPTLSRNRVFGGSSSTWSGRVAAFDDIDFSARSWIPGSGWPLTREEIACYLPRTMPYLGIAIADNNDPALRDYVLGRDAHTFDPTLLTDYVWSYSRDVNRPRDFMRFGPRVMREGIAGARCLLNATVSHVDTNDEGTEALGLRVVGPDGRERVVQARDIVLCAGGIDNARILLASTQHFSSGVGNSHDRVGRYLMDHPRGEVAAFAEKDIAAVQRTFGSYRVKINGVPAVVTRGFALSRVVQESEGLLNCAAWLNGVMLDSDPFHAISKLARFREPVDSLADIVRGARLVVRGFGRVARGRSPMRDLASLQLVTIVEQVPNPDSRVTLADTVDSLGIRRAKIDWRLDDREARTTRRMAHLVAQELGRVGLPVPTLVPMIADPNAPFYFPDIAHPTGTTRMSTDPSSGVVDRNCAVHNVAGLHCAGTSVFPTAGHANPTQTALALAIRLAERLAADRRRHMGAPSAIPHNQIATPLHSVSTRPVAVPSGGGEKPRILVTGARGKIGSRLMIALGGRFEVRALTSRRPPTVPSNVEWVSRDLRRADLDFTAEVEGCVAVLHLGAELRHVADMNRTNVEATGALAHAAAAAGSRFFCYLSSVSVYGSAIASSSSEDGPTLTPDRDVPSEYWADDALRAYGRSKLGGELAVARAAATALPSLPLEVVVFRPSVVVDLEEVKHVYTWGTARRALLARRHAHHVFVDDVAAAVIWALDRSLARAEPVASIETFNLDDWTVDDPTFGAILSEFDAVAPGSRSRVPALPVIFDWFKERLRYRRGLAARRPIGMMSFSTDRLRNAGFSPPIGMTRVRADAAAALAQQQKANIVDK